MGRRSCFLYKQRRFTLSIVGRSRSHRRGQDLGRRSPLLCLWLRNFRENCKIGRDCAPQVLVLAPTRELASQVSRDFSDITKKLALACFYGGTPYGGQTECMWNGISILVGTLGHIKDHLQNGKLDPTKLKHVVLDEVDQMLDMGFVDQV